MAAPEPVLPTRQALGTVLVARTALSELAHASATLVELGFAAKLGGQVVLIRPKQDLPVVARRVIELEGGSDRVCVDDGENGRRTYALRCVLDAEPSEQQWREAVAELCSRLLQGQARHFTMEELRRTAEHTARLYECWQELDAWHRTNSGAAGSASTFPVWLINGLARILQGPADNAAMSLIWAAWALHLQPWTEASARRLGGERGATTTQPPTSDTAAGVAAALPTQQSRTAAVGRHGPDAVAHAGSHPHHHKKPPPVIVGGDNEDRPLDTWPLTPSPPGSSACKSHESGDEEDVETLDGPGSSGLLHTMSRVTDGGRGECCGVWGSTGGGLGISAREHQDRVVQREEEGQPSAAYQWLGKDSSRSRDALLSAGDQAEWWSRRRARSRSRSRSPSGTQQQAQHPRSRSPQQIRPHSTVARPKFTEEDQKWGERLHRWLLRQPQRKAAINRDVRMSVPEEMLERLGITTYQFYLAWPKLFAVDGPFAMAIDRSSTASTAELGSSRSGGATPTARVSQPWEEPQHEPASSRPQVTAEEEEEMQWAHHVHQFLLKRPNLEASAGTLLSEGLGVPQRFLDRKRQSLMEYLASFKHLWTLEKPGVRGKAVLLHAVPTRQQQPAANSAAGMAMQETEGSYVRRLYSHLVEKLPAGVEVNTLKQGNLRIPSHLIGRRYYSVSAFLRCWRDEGLWHISEEKPLVLTAVTGGRVQQVLDRLN